MITVQEALDKILLSGKLLPTHTIPIEQSISYYLKYDVKADRPLPPFNRVAMDGFAVQSDDFKDRTKAEFRIAGHIQTGIENDFVVKSGEAVQIMTGAPCPAGADAIVKIENAEISGDKVILTEDKMEPWLNIAPEGEDAEKGKVLIPANSSLTTAGIAICASVGLEEVEVFQKPRIAIMSTGTEIIPPKQDPLPHQIRDCNSFSLRTMSNIQDAEFKFLGIGEDDTGVLSSMIQEGLEYDILILSGGVSMGEYDHVPGLLAENGVEKIFHNIKVKPGKPVWFGKTEKTYVFGLPGNPVSVQTCFRLFVEPLIKKISGASNPKHHFMKLPLSADAKSKTPREYYMPGKLVFKDELSAIEPVVIRGSGDFSNFRVSDGILRFPAEETVLKEGTIVDFLPWREIW